MKKLAIIALNKETCFFYEKQITEIFNSLIEIDGYWLENSYIDYSINADLVLITSPVIFDLAKRVVQEKTEIIIMRRTLTLDGFEKLKKIKPNSKVMLVNVTLELAIETITQIYELGIKDVNFIPVNKEMKNIPDIDIAVTPGELSYVPNKATKVINIGNRVLDISTIINIIVKLDLDLTRTRYIVDKYLKKIAPLNTGLHDVWNESNELKMVLQIILNMYKRGVIAVDNKGRIIEINKIAEGYFELTKTNIIGEYIDRVIPELELKKVLETRVPCQNMLISYNDKDIVVNHLPIIQQGRLLGIISFSEEFYEIEDSHQKLRKNIIRKGYVAKYEFKDIIGESKIIKKTKLTAAKMSKSDSSIIIMGNSGTGKELFAQAIHNASNRRNEAFVAVNCSAISESLLESELFGYEEGAFTGAKKGGSKGLFELAHNGTIFLDEIGEISTNIQSKLLRVLQEKEIRRVGGTNVINIDARVIAATNKDLKQMVIDGRFREDLYYRLAVFPLHLPTLKERKEDVPLLIRAFLESKEFNTNIPKDIMKILINYDWPGNIRQLQNCIEYVIQLSDNQITIDDLPIDIKKSEYNFIEYIPLDERDKLLIEQLKKDKESVFILYTILNAYTKKKCIGRRTICQLANENGLFLSEQMIRYRLKKLESMNLVSISKGRMGTKLTDYGDKIIKGLNRVN